MTLTIQVLNKLTPSPESVLILVGMSNYNVVWCVPLWGELRDLLKNSSERGTSFLACVEKCFSEEVIFKLGLAGPEEFSTE